MYYPYLRGKQNELILLRENAELISKSQISPIIEPVKSNLNPLLKSFRVLISELCSFSIIINPIYGDFSFDNIALIDCLNEEGILDYENLNVALICDEDTDINTLEKYIKDYPDNNITLIHYGFTDGRELEKLLSNFKNQFTHIFIEKFAQKRYRRIFTKDKRILIKDGFNKQKSNKDYPAKEHFSELHIMYEDENMDGFGDFLINGDEYSESGGPAYAVAIHLTYLDEDDEDDMFIKHYISDSNSSPADPGGKFLEALTKLVNDTDPKVFASKAHQEFLKLAQRQHYPGLGYVKKLSMQHHLESIADFLK